MKKILFLIIHIFSIYNMIIAENILIGDMYYEFSGTQAIVTHKRQGQYSDSWGACYVNDEYTIPETVIYGGLTYDVKRIGSYAFGSMNGINDAAKFRRIHLSESIDVIEKGAFNYCGNLIEIVIPSSVDTMQIHQIIQGGVLKDVNVFSGCNLLRKIIYTSETPPSGWVATDLTYVPNINDYGEPHGRINNPAVFEMITFLENEFTYTGYTPNVSWINNIEGYTASLDLSSLNIDVGTYEHYIPVTYTNDFESFTVNIKYNYTIKPISLVVTADNVSREYGDDNPEFTLSYSGFINNDNETIITNNPTIYTTATKTSNVGDYPIIITGGDAPNYELVHENGTLSITKAQLSGKVSDITKVYGSYNPTFNIEYYGLKNNESYPDWETAPSFQTNATQSSGVGKYEVSAHNGIPINYDLTEILSGILSIEPASLQIKADNNNKLYYSENPNFTYTCDGFVNGDNESVLSSPPTLTTSATLSSNVGVYDINVSEVSSPNYTITHTNGTFEILPRTLIASVRNYERLYNEENPIFDVIYEGFVNGETPDILISHVIAQTDATQSSDAGIYEIELSGGYAENYEFSYKPGTLTINKIEQSISWEQDLSNLNIGDQIELNAFATSGLPVTYTTDCDNSIAEIYMAGNKYYLDCKKSSVFIIYALQDGNENYYLSPKVTKNVKINNVETFIEESSDLSVNYTRIPNGIRVKQSNTKDMIYIYTIDGNLYNSIMPSEYITEIPLKEGNVYIIKIGRYISKIYL